MDVGGVSSPRVWRGKLSAVPAGRQMVSSVGKWQTSSLSGPPYSRKVTSLASFSGTSTGKSRVDMSSPVHHVATPLKARIHYPCSRASFLDTVNTAI